MWNFPSEKKNPFWTIYQPSLVMLYTTDSARIQTTMQQRVCFPKFKFCHLCCCFRAKYKIVLQSSLSWQKFYFLWLIIFSTFFFKDQGSDYSLLQIFQNHTYKITYLLCTLCIFLAEKTWNGWERLVEDKEQDKKPPLLSVDLLNCHDFMWMKWKRELGSVYSTINLSFKPKDWATLKL